MGIEPMTFALQGQRSTNLAKTLSTPEWLISHIFTSDNIDDVISNFFILGYTNSQWKWQSIFCVYDKKKTEC